MDAMPAGRRLVIGVAIRLRHSRVEHQPITRMNDVDRLIWEYVANGLADQLLARHAIDLFAGAVDEYIAQVLGVLYADGGRNVVDDQLKKAPGLRQFALSFAQFGDV